MAYGLSKNDELDIRTGSGRFRSPLYTYAIRILDKAKRESVSENMDARTAGQRLVIQQLVEARCLLPVLDRPPVPHHRSTHYNTSGRASFRNFLAIRDGRPIKRAKAKKKGPPPRRTWEERLLDDPFDGV